MALPLLRKKDATGFLSKAKKEKKISLGIVVINSLVYASTKTFNMYLRRF
jgi:hypothetical protein